MRFIVNGYYHPLFFGYSSLQRSDVNWPFFFINKSHTLGKPDSPRV
jgi:hypothetical protein